MNKELVKVIHDELKTYGLFTEKDVSLKIPGIISAMIAEKVVKFIRSANISEEMPF